jgi:hypothetical protein
VGIGASVALNIANASTRAEIADTAVLTGADDVTLKATSDNTALTTAKAGGAATGGSGVGIGGAIATSVVNNETVTIIGEGTPLIITATLSQRHSILVVRLPLQTGQQEAQAQE